MNVRFKNENGMALVLVLIFSGALMVVGAALITHACNEKLIANYNTLDKRLYYLAEAGAEAGIAALQGDFYFSGELNGTLGEGSYTIIFTVVDQTQRDIISYALLDGYKRALAVRVEQDENGTVIVKEWRRHSHHH